MSVEQLLENGGIITLHDEEGKSHDFEILTVLERDEELYLVLGLVGDENEAEEELPVYVFLAEEDGDEIHLTPVEDEETLQEIEEFLSDIADDEDDEQ